MVSEFTVVPVPVRPPSADPYPEAEDACRAVRRQPILEEQPAYGAKLLNDDQWKWVGKPDSASISAHNSRGPSAISIVGATRFYVRRPNRFLLLQSATMSALPARPALPASRRASDTTLRAPEHAA